MAKGQLNAVQVPVRMGGNTLDMFFLSLIFFQILLKVFFCFPGMDLQNGVHPQKEEAPAFGMPAQKVLAAGLGTDIDF